jgi:L-aspartate oxidase
MKTDILVIGSGIAGLSFALKASKLGKVTILTKRNAFESNTADAQGGIAIPTSSEDAKKHIADTLNAGRGLCNEKAVRLMVHNAQMRIGELVDLGVKLEKQNGKLKRALEAGHSAARVVYNRDATGRAIEHRLVMAAKENSQIELLENSIAVDFILRKNRCFGAQYLDSSNQFHNLHSKFTILASGGLGQLYEKTTNPQGATGDGFAMALRAGAKLENMEFVQFHPTKLDIPSDHPFLISEVLRGEGGILVNQNGKAFMKNYDPAGELAPRDVVARAIYRESHSGKVFLDMRHKSQSFLQKRFPTIYAKCLGYDIDLAEDLVPVTAAAHYICGGVRTDLLGQTSIGNLYAIGEVACTGVHGANRLASNSLLEGLVFSHEAYLDISVKFPKTQILQIPFLIPKVSQSTSHYIIRKKLRAIMWEKVGLVRKKSELANAIKQIAEMNDQIKKEMKVGINYDLIETKNMFESAFINASSALKRKESLGCHYVVK